MYLKSLEISDMRCFRHTEAAFQYQGREQEKDVKYPNINVLMGNNGMGKTATLKSIALAILSPIIESAGYVPYSIVRRDRRKQQPHTEIKGVLELHKQDIESADRSPDDTVEIQTTVERIKTTERIKRQMDEDPLWISMFDNKSPAFLLVGYGASRTVERSDTFDLSARRKSRLLRYDRVSGLFEEHATLIPLATWLPEMRKGNPGRHKQVVNLINRLLPESADFTGDYEDGEYQFRHRGLRVPFGAMSDGYRAYLGWVCDLLYHVCMGCPKGVKLVDNHGIVLIDEIDLHLHPEWQLSVLPRLSHSLPRLQFICSTHSPIVAGTVESVNVHLLLPDGDQASRLAEPEVEIHGLNADQILLSPHFGLTSSRAPAFVEELREVSQEARGGDPEAALRFTRMVSHGAGGASLERKRARPEWIEHAAEQRKTEAQKKQSRS